MDCKTTWQLCDNPDVALSLIVTTKESRAKDMTCGMKVYCKHT